MDGDAGVRAHQEVLSPRVHPVDGMPAEIGRGIGRDPEIGREQTTAGERLVQAPGRDENGVAFGHAGLQASLPPGARNEQRPRPAGWPGGASAP